VVQPDLLVVCDRNKLDKRGCNGAPDLIIEILSPSSASCDRVLKFNRYLRAGVREYWIVDPEYRTVSGHVLENGKYVTAPYGQEDTVPVHVRGVRWTCGMFLKRKNKKTHEGRKGGQCP